MDQTISSQRVSFLPCSIKRPVSNANSVDPDQMPHSAASDLGLHSLPLSLSWDARYKWVNGFKDLMKITECLDEF